MRAAIGRNADRAQVRGILERADAEVGPTQWRVSPKQIFQIAYEPAEALQRLRPGDYALDSTRYHFAMAEVLEQLHAMDSAQVHWDVARARMEQALAGGEDQHWLHSDLGVVYAKLGRREEALRSARLATEMLPVSRDALDGPEYVVNLAWVHTILGDEDEALHHLERALAIPSWLTRGLLRTEPRWAPLRDHPDFHLLVSGDDNG
jgi:tetratricopeptide (TPR) repeat protein